MTELQRADNPPPSRLSSRRLAKMFWIAKLAIGKMREGPGPWLRAVRRGLFDALPPRWKASLARRRYRLPEIDPRRLALDVGEVEVPGEVTVVLPVFNHSDLLKESIDSVLAQSFAPFELIVLDDGSTDGIDAVLAAFASDKRVRILTQENLGLPAALTNGFAFAGGEFRSWTSADNVMEPAQLERLVAFLREHPSVAMVYADYRVIGADGVPLVGSDFRPQNRTSPESCEVRLPRTTETLNLLQDNFIGACFLYRGWVGRCLGPYSSDLGIEDYDYWMRVHAEFGIEHLGTDELLYRYRWHENSLNARARELRLFETGQRLMEHERTRALWRAAPWQILADERQARWLAPLDLASDEWQPFASPFAASDDKRLVLATAKDFTPEDLDALPDDLVVALDWSLDNGVSSTVYRWADRLRDPRLLHFATDPMLQRALAVFTDQVFSAEPGVERLALACSRGNEMVCARRAGVDASQPLPRVWSAPGRRRRLLMQADDFVQGGLECVVLDLAECLGRRGFDCALLVLGEQGPMAERARDHGLEVLTLRERSADAYAALLDAHGIELVLAHHSLFGADVAQARGVAFVQTLHNTYHWFYPDEIDAWRRADPATTAYVHVSANVTLFAHQKLGLSVDKSIVLSNGVRLPRAGELPAAGAELRRSLGLAADDYVFLNVASLYPPKSQVPIAEALAVARAEDPRIKVVLLGRSMNEAYAAELRRTCDELGLGDALIVAGFHPDPEPFYELADAFLLPSYWEGCSLAVAEALVRDLPCVLTDVGAARQQLSVGEGVVVAPPFAAIEELDFGNLKQSLATPRVGFVEDLAAALVVTGRRAGRLPEDRARRERFDLEGVAERYARVLAWIQDGGRPAQARRFAWADYREGELR